MTDDCLENQKSFLLYDNAMSFFVKSAGGFAGPTQFASASLCFFYTTERILSELLQHERRDIHSL